MGTMASSLQSRVISEGNDYQLDPRQRTPHEKLILAILLRAVFDLVGSDQIHRRSAYTFIFAKGAPKNIWSFKWMCSILNLDPELFLNRYRSVAADKLPQEIAADMGIPTHYKGPKNYYATSKVFRSAASANRRLRNSGLRDGKFSKAA